MRTFMTLPQVTFSKSSESEDSDAVYTTDAKMRAVRSMPFAGRNRSKPAREGTEEEKKTETFDGLDQ